MNTQLELITESGADRPTLASIRLKADHAFAELREAVAAGMALNLWAALENLEDWLAHDENPSQADLIHRAKNLDRAIHWEGAALAEDERTCLRAVVSALWRFINLQRELAQWERAALAQAVNSAQGRLFFAGDDVRSLTLSPHGSQRLLTSSPAGQ
jgi:hypothetical protein